MLSVLLALPMAVLMLLIRLDSPGPAIYRQERLGKDGKPFTILKLRTMRLDAEKNGPRWAETNDSRCTRLGRFLRKTRIDELPQLWNILRGEMSFVGPRPERAYFYLAFPPDELFSALAGAIDNRYFSARFAELALFLRQRSIRGDLQIRLQCYLYSLRSFAAHPLGIGPWYSYVVGDRGIGYHSAILDDMARYGLAALAFYGVFLAKYYRMLREQWARIGLRAAAAIITAGWALLLLLNIAFRAADESIFMLYILPVLPDILLQSRKKTE